MVKDFLKFELRNVTFFFFLKTDTLKQPNFVVHQVTGKLPLQLEIFYESKFFKLTNSFVDCEAMLRGQVYDTLLQKYRKILRNVFESKFHLQKKGFTGDEQEFAMFAMSNLIEGIGPIWIYVNYLVAHALHHYSKAEGPHQVRATVLYNGLYENLIGNVLREYKKTERELDKASYFQLRFQFELYFYIHLIYCRPFTRRLVYASHAVSVWNICLKKV